MIYEVNDDNNSFLKYKLFSIKNVHRFNITLHHIPSSYILSVEIDCLPQNVANCDVIKQNESELANIGF